MLPITVHVPENRVKEFYVRFAEFIVETPDPSAPITLESGTAPAWIQSSEAAEIAANLWNEISLAGRGVLRHLVDAAKKETARLTAEELVALSGHPHGKAGIAGILGGVGKAIRRVGLPMYRTPKGNSWHYVWDWDGEMYSMTPEVAALLRAARRPQP